MAVWWRVKDRLRFASMTFIKLTKVDELVPYLLNTLKKYVFLNVNIKTHLVQYKYTVDFVCHVCCLL
jgi:hypothetical protein